MKQLGRLISGFSFVKGKLYTVIGFVIIAFSLYLMIDKKEITQDGLSLLFVGLTLSGFHHEILKNPNDTTNTGSSLAP